MESSSSDKVDLRERGGMKDGQPQRSDRRLFMQLLVWTDCMDVSPLINCLSSASIEGVLYADLHHPQGVALLTLSQAPEFFVTDLRSLLNQAAFKNLQIRPELSMFGRTYALGYESDLEDTLIGRPRRTALNPDWPWSIWYPLRRKGEFALLDPQQQRSILGEHGAIGHSFGASDLAHDIRLACHGLDAQDNDFMIGLTGRDLFPLSALVQTMRKTQQTSTFVEKMGPFFVGRSIWKSPL